MKLTNGFGGFVLFFFVTSSLVFAEAAIFNIKDFGAVGDGKTLNTRAIQAAIDKCSQNGGGKVYVPPGIFVTGTFYLYSRVNLHLESGAVILGSPNLSDYQEKYVQNDTSHYGIIYAHKAENVAITGLGAIDGNDKVFFEWDKDKKIVNAGLEYVRQKNRFRWVESGIGDGPVVPKLRPRQMVIFSECKDVTVRDIKLLNSPFWTLHFADCDGVIVSGIKLWASLEVPNADGIDVTSCQNVLISDCDIRSGDDCIAITGYAFHYELPGYHNLRHVSENINVTNCNLISRSSGIRIGGVDQNSMRNYNFSNINIYNSNRGIGIFVRDEGSIENLTFSNMFIETRLHTGDWWGNGEPIHISAIRGRAGVKLGVIKNIKFNNIICRSEGGILIYGTEESVIQNIDFTSLDLQLLNSPMNETAGGNFDLRPVLDPRFALFAHDTPAFYAGHVEDLNIDNFRIDWQFLPNSFITNGLEVNHFRGFRLHNFRGAESFKREKFFPVSLKNGESCFLDVPKDWIGRENLK